MRLPEFYRWDGGELPSVWSFGWWKGKDDDLLCVNPKAISSTEAEMALSPVCSNRLLALLGFICKLVLIKIDKNIMWRCEEERD